MTVLGRWPPPWTFRARIPSTPVERAFHALCFEHEISQRVLRVCVCWSTQLLRAGIEPGWQALGHHRADDTIQCNYSVHSNTTQVIMTQRFRVEFKLINYYSLRPHFAEKMISKSGKNRLTCREVFRISPK